MRAACRLAAALLAAATLQAPLHAADFPYDVPYVPTPPVVVDEMLRMAGVTANDYVMDLGCGDGRIVIDAAKKFGARGIGIDLDEELLADANANAQAAGVTDRVSFARQDLFKMDLSQATVITMYLLPSVNRRLKPELLKLKPGTRIVSHDFDLEDWVPDRKATIRKNVFLWIVPAPVAGVWRISTEVGGAPRSYEVEIRQKYQEIDGFVRGQRTSAGLWQAGLEGDRITFAIVDSAGNVPGEAPARPEAGLYFEGRVQGDRMEGLVRRDVGRGQSEARWRAERVKS
jgi:SAM-dependent methyltransferase